VKFNPTAGRFFVRLTSKLVWFIEDQNGPIASAKHTYTKYGLVPFSGVEPNFGDQQKTRPVAPNIYP
jgi:hypothetical protein